MSRTYKDRGYRRRLVKNSLYKKQLNLWGEDFQHKRKDRQISRRLRAKLKDRYLKDSDVDESTRNN